jgi:hypothetical protein
MTKAQADGIRAGDWVVYGSHCAKVNAISLPPQLSSPGIGIM